VGVSARQLTAIKDVGLLAHETTQLDSMQTEPEE